MPKLKFKTKCKVCYKNWVTIKFREFPICVGCQMKQVGSEEVKGKKYKFLNIDQKLYEKSRFLRNIRISFNRYDELTAKQIEAFKKAVDDIKKGKTEVEEV